MHVNNQNPRQRVISTRKKVQMKCYGKSEDAKITAIWRDQEKLHRMRSI